MGLAPAYAPEPEPTPTPEDSTEDRDATAPAQFVAGWYYGVIGDDKRDYIIDCYQMNDDLTNALYDGMEAYIAGDQETGDSKMKSTKDLYATALATCTEVGEKM